MATLLSSPNVTECMKNFSILLQSCQSNNVPSLATFQDLYGRLKILRNDLGWTVAQSVGNDALKVRELVDSIFVTLSQRTQSVLSFDEPASGSEDEEANNDRETTRWVHTVPSELAAMLQDLDLLQRLSQHTTRSQYRANLNVPVRSKPEMRAVGRAPMEQSFSRVADVFVEKHFPHASVWMQTRIKAMICQRRGDFVDGLKQVARRSPDQIHRIFSYWHSQSVEVTTQSQADQISTSFPTTGNVGSFLVAEQKAETRSESEHTGVRCPSVPTFVSEESAHCPICLKQVSTFGVMNQESWKEHMESDLNMYICIFEDCRLHDQTFNHVRQWINHTKQSHSPSKWRCASKAHDPLDFATRDECKRHVALHLARGVSEKHIELVVERCSWTQLPHLFDCPLCCCRVDFNIFKHIALHFETIAFEALQTIVSNSLFSLQQLSEIDQNPDVKEAPEDFLFTALQRRSLSIERGAGSLSRDSRGSAKRLRDYVNLLNPSLASEVLPQTISKPIDENAQYVKSKSDGRSRRRKNRSRMSSVVSTSEDEARSGISPPHRGVETTPAPNDIKEETLQNQLFTAVSPIGSDSSTHSDPPFLKRETSPILSFNQHIAPYVYRDEAKLPVRALSEPPLSFDNDNAQKLGVKPHVPSFSTSQPQNKGGSSNPPDKKVFDFVTVPDIFPAYMQYLLSRLGNRSLLCCTCKSQNASALRGTCFACNHEFCLNCSIVDESRLETKLPATLPTDSVNFSAETWGIKSDPPEEIGTFAASQLSQSPDKQRIALWEEFEPIIANLSSTQLDFIRFMANDNNTKLTSPAEVPSKHVKKTSLLDRSNKARPDDLSIRPYGCRRDGCSKFFTQKNIRLKHEKRHDRLFFCTFDECFKRFGSKDDLRRHETRTHQKPIKGWRCFIDDVSNLRYRLDCAPFYQDIDAFRQHRRYDHHERSRPGGDLIAVNRCFVVQGIPGNFWCGFCAKVIIDEASLIDGTRRDKFKYDHITHHIVRELKSPDQWLQLSTNMAKITPQPDLVETSDDESNA